MMCLDLILQCTFSEPDLLRLDGQRRELPVSKGVNLLELGGTIHGNLIDTEVAAWIHESCLGDLGL